jgi:hypothetical protein
MAGDNELAVEEKRLSNLKPFVAGDERINRGGRPKGSSVTALWRKLLDEVDAEEVETPRRAEVLFYKAYSMAKGGDKNAIHAIRLIVERVEGKPPQSVTLTMDTRERLETAVNGGVELASCSRDEAIGRSRSTSRWRVSC